MDNWSINTDFTKFLEITKQFYYLLGTVILIYIFVIFNFILSLKSHWFLNNLL